MCFNTVSGMAVHATIDMLENVLFFGSFNTVAGMAVHATYRIQA